MPGYTARMVRALYLEVPDEVLAERRRIGIDRRDEVWDGVIHMVPLPSGPHMDVSFELAVALRTVAQRRGLKVHHEAGLFDHDTNYRVPDIIVARPELLTHRGWEGAELVVEVLSPNDESREKLPFFAKLGLREVWFVDPETRAIELLVLRKRAGPRLRIRDGAEIIDV